jgi:hypothetical protein
LAWGDILGDAQLIDLKNRKDVRNLRVVQHPDNISFSDIYQITEKAKSDGTIVALLVFSEDSRDLAESSYRGAISLFRGLTGTALVSQLPKDISLHSMAFTRDHRLILGALRTTEPGPIYTEGGNLLVFLLNAPNKPLISIAAEKHGEVVFDRLASRVAIIIRHKEQGLYTETSLKVWDLFPLKELPLKNIPKLKTLEYPLAFAGNRETLILKLQPMSQLEMLSLSSDGSYRLDSSPLSPVEQLTFVQGYLNISRQFLSSLYGIRNGRVVFRASRASRVGISDNATVTVQVESDGGTYLQSAKLAKPSRTPVTGGNYGAIRVTDNGAMVWTTDNNYGGSTCIGV